MLLAIPIVILLRDSFSSSRAASFDLIQKPIAESTTAKNGPSAEPIIVCHLLRKSIVLELMRLTLLPAGSVEKNASKLAKFWVFGFSYAVQLAN
jgi:hypothetical protein